MTKYTLYIGLNDKDTKTQIIKDKEAEKLVTNILKINNIEGFTLYKGMGLYKHNNGEIVKEKTLILIIYDFNNNINIIEAIEMLKVAINQESIALEKQVVESELI